MKKRKYLHTVVYTAGNEQLEKYLKSYAKEYLQKQKGEVQKQENDEIDLPDYITDIMNGAAYSSPEDCTSEEQRILFDPIIKDSIIQYRITNDFSFAIKISERMKEIQNG